MGYHLSQEAEEDITSIAAIGIAEFGLDQARRYHDGLFELFGLLATNPEMARERMELHPPVRIHRYRSHMVIYRIDGHDITIIRVRHGREDWMSDPA
ncbi:type II toxin-antitoxin system RelE/ParE family toxin [Roseovarius sp. CAU 1744]|uniref:type II toxin-antitoxin system RelE/ParE family toxin n=1 Tax=Roseovarius sp. CAU 1744 TaxID=3140368 RepID=UPI00325AE58E